MSRIKEKKNEINYLIVNKNEIPQKKVERRFRPLDEVIKKKHYNGIDAGRFLLDWQQADLSRQDVNNFKVPMIDNDKAYQGLSVKERIEYEEFVGVQQWIKDAYNECRVKDPTLWNSIYQIMIYYIKYKDETSHINLRENIQKEIFNIGECYYYIHGFNTAIDLIGNFYKVDMDGAKYKPLQSCN